METPNGLKKPPPAPVPRFSPAQDATGSAWEVCRPIKECIVFGIV